MRSIKAIALAVLTLGLAIVPVASVWAVPPPGTITVVQDLSEPCGDTTGADLIVTIDNGAPNTMYGAEVLGVAGNRVVTNAQGDATMRLENIGLEDVDVQISAANYDTRTILAEVQCGTGHGKD